MSVVLQTGVAQPLARMISSPSITKAMIAPFAVVVLTGCTLSPRAYAPRAMEYLARAGGLPSTVPAPDWQPDFTNDPSVYYNIDPWGKLQSVDFGDETWSFGCRAIYAHPVVFDYSNVEFEIVLYGTHGLPKAMFIRDSYAQIQIRSATDWEIIQHARSLANLDSSRFQSPALRAMVEAFE